MTMGKQLICRFLGTTILLLVIQANAEEKVAGYTSYGRGSCQDTRGKMYSYLQRVMTFPNAETCGRQECERFGNMASYRGFEFSVTNRCTCLFDVDEIPVVPNDADAPQYVSKADSGMGGVTAASGTPGAYCYQFGANAGVMTGSGFFTASLLVASSTIYLML